MGALYDLIGSAGFGQWTGNLGGPEGPEESGNPEVGGFCVYVDCIYIHIYLRIGIYRIYIQHINVILSNDTYMFNVYIYMSYVCR